MKLNFAVSKPGQKNKYNNTKQQVSFKGVIKPFHVHSNYKIKMPYDKISGFLTAIVSTVGFGVGGFGLFSDFLSNKKNKEQANKTIFKPQEKRVFKNFKTTRDIRELSIPKELKDVHKEGEFGNIQPKTKFGKIGLNFAKVGIMFSGIAGFFNGIAMKIPLMAAGESVNVASSPIINTPTGFGLFNIGLAAIFAGRALENDPSLKLNSAVLKSKPTFKEKAAYVGKNMADCLKEVVKSTKVVGQNIANLVAPSASKEVKDLIKEGKPQDVISKAIKTVKNNSKMFFRDNVLAIRPSTITFSEKITANGKKVIEAGLKSPPYRMHAASLLLALGGGLLTISGILKNIGVFKKDTAIKTSFKIAEAGGMLDNIGLAYFGMEKMAMGHKAAGLPLAISGFTVLTGTPQAEKDYGRALQWIGCCALFLTFAIERGLELQDVKKGMKALKNTGMIDEAAELIRQWEVALPKAMDKKDLKPHLKYIDKVLGLEKKNSVGLGDKLKQKVMNMFDNAFSKGETLSKTAKNADKEILKEQAREAMSKAKNKKVADVVDLTDEIKEFLSKGRFEESKMVDNVSHIQNELQNHLIAKGIDKELASQVKIVTEGKTEEIAKSVIMSNIKKFGENYKDELNNIMNDSKTPQKIVKEAKDALSKMA